METREVEGCPKDCSSFAALCREAEGSVDDLHDQRSAADKFISSTAPPCCYHCPMAARRILQLGDPLLRLISQPIAPLETGAVLQDLEDTLSEFRRGHGFGRAISAIQIGARVRVIFMQVDGVRYELINPELTWRSPESFELWDDCFSFPDLMVRLQRHCGVRLTHENRDGSASEIQATGALAELIQHEIDHLDGVLAVDRALDRNSLCTRTEWLRQNRSG